MAAVRQAANFLAGIVDTILNLVAALTRPRVHFGYVCVVLSATCAILYFGFVFNIFPDPPGLRIPEEVLEPDEALLAVGTLAAGILGLIVMLAGKRRKRPDPENDG